MDQNDTVLLVVKTLVTTLGESQVTMDAIVNATGVSRATLYRRYGGRAKLIALMHQTYGTTSAPQDLPARERIMESVREIIARQGDINASIETIAQHASVSPMSIYRIFHDRLSLIQQSCESLAPYPDPEGFFTRSDQDPIDIITSFAHNMIIFCCAYPGLTTLMMTTAIAPQETFATLKRRQNSSRVAFAKFLKVCMEQELISPQNAEHLVSDFVGLILAASILRPQPNDEHEIEARAAHVVHQFLYGATPL